MSLSDLRAHAARIYRAALAAADPALGIQRLVRLESHKLHVPGASYDLTRYDRVLVLGAGKATAAMAHAVEQLLGDALPISGLINVKYGHTASLRYIQQRECGHPLPDEAGLHGAREIAALAAAAGPRDLVLCLISGGASALMPLPAPPLTLADKQSTTELLLRCGANIQEINAVRKHLSAIKGGQLARLAWPATILTLLLSDVIGDDLGVIGSGPTYPDSSTYAGALAVLDRYGLRASVPATVRSHLEQGEAEVLPETPKAGEVSAHHVIIGSNDLAVTAAAREAQACGYQPLVLSTRIAGETREIAECHLAIAAEIHATHRPLAPPACLLSGGETTVTLRGQGKGGRNQEFVLAAVPALAQLPNTVVVSIGTDGTDGPTDAAGAIADTDTMARAQAAGLSVEQALTGNDSYPFFHRLDDLIRTGPTGTNVMDVHLILIAHDTVPSLTDAR